jgi:hypothetical protein
MPGQKRGPEHTGWKGGRTRRPKGYIMIQREGFPEDGGPRYVAEHVLVAERVLGKPLPAGAVVHHVNEDKADNRPANLVICPDHQYHMLLHQRMKARDACGNPNWRKCQFCKQYDDPERLCVQPRKVFHKSCRAAYERERSKRAKT